MAFVSLIVGPNVFSIMLCGIVLWDFANVVLRVRLIISTETGNQIKSPLVAPGLAVCIGSIVVVDSGW